MTFAGAVDTDGFVAAQPVEGEEIERLLIHGLLHLAGYDDLAPAKKRMMRRAEARALDLLRSARCLPRFRFAFSSRS